MTEPSKVAYQAVPAQLKNNLYYRDTYLANKYSVSRVTIWRWVKEGTYPPPVKLSPGCTRWYGPDINKWEAEQVA